MNKKLIKRFLTAVFLLVFLLVTVLAVHIYMVSRPETNSTGIRKQLSRIDFATVPMDSLTATQVVKAIEEIPEVLSYYLNEETGAMAYSVEAGENRAQLAFEAFMSKGDFDAKRYIPSPESIANGCPVIEKKSLTYKLGKFFQDLFS